MATDIFGRTVDLGQPIRVPVLPLPTLIDTKFFGVAVLVLPISLVDHVLVAKRIGCPYMNNLWQWPGGIIETAKMESAHMAAQRELLEETGIHVPSRYSFQLLCSGIGMTEIGKPYVTQFFTVRPAYIPTPCNTEPHKHSDWEFVHFDELLKRPLISLMPLVIEEARRAATGEGV